MTVTASYLVQAAPGTDRDPVDWNPEFSRRARGVPVYAALASLGREGIEEIIERCCAHARRFAELLGRRAGRRGAQRRRAEPGARALPRSRRAATRITTPGRAP